MRDTIEIEMDIIIWWFSSTQQEFDIVLGGE